MRVAIALLLLTIPLAAEPPILGQATLYPGQVPGPGGHHVYLGITAMGKTMTEAAATVWVVESEGKEQWSSKGICTDKYSNGTTVLCEVPIPVLQDVHRVRVRAAGTTEWSGVWLSAMIPCGFFVGEPVFRNSTELMGWPSFSVGSECAALPDPPQPPSAPPADLRILASNAISLGKK